MRDYRLHELMLPVLAAMMQQQKPHLQVASDGVERLLTLDRRISPKCISLLLDSVVQSAAWAAEEGAAAPVSAGRSGVDLAEAMLLQMISPGMTSRFQVNEFAWAVVLQGLTQLCGDRRSVGFDERMRRARSFYNSIPDKGAFAHSILLTAYQRVGLESEAMALRGDPVEAMSPGITTARLAHIHQRLNTHRRQAQSDETRMALSSHERELLREAEGVWQAAKEQPLQRLNAAVTSSMLKLHHVTGDIPRQLQIIQEALQVEAERSESRSVYVDAACYSHCSTRWL